MTLQSAQVIRSIMIHAYTHLLLILFIYRYLVVHLTSSVGIATRYGMDGPGIGSRWGRDFPQPSIPDLGPTQTLVAAAWH